MRLIFFEVSFTSRAVFFLIFGSKRKKEKMQKESKMKAKRKKKMKERKKMKARKKI